jgi:HAD superfamily phosphoserine phosphatase-like hydrolase
METIGARKLDRTQQEFLESVLRLEPRVAAFDCDGTLWSGDAGVTFFDWEIEQGIVSREVATFMRARYVEYQAGKVSEEDMCGEMVTMHKGIAEAVMMQAAAEFMAQAFPGHIFAEMQELVSRLQQARCEVWAVSSSNEWVIRAAMRHFGIAENRVLAAAVAIDNGTVTDRLIRMPSGPGKAKALREAHADVDAAFGNSRWDTEMLKMARHAFAVNPNPDLLATARAHGWTVYFPEEVRGE